MAFRDRFPGVPPPNTWEVAAVARNRYGWEKRAKELARKQRNEEKQKRRQGKGQPHPEAEPSRPVEEES